MNELGEFMNFENDAVLSACSWETEESRDSGIKNDKNFGLEQSDVAKNLKCAEHALNPDWYVPKLEICDVEHFNSLRAKCNRFNLLCNKAIWKRGKYRR